MLVFLSLQFFWAIYLKDQGLNGFQIGSLFAIATITGLLFTLPFGILNDRYHSKNLITLGAFLYATQLILSSFTTFYPFLLILFFIGGLGLSLFAISLNALFYKVLGTNNKEKRIGYFQFWAHSGAVLGMLSSGTIQELFSFPFLLRIGAVIVILIALLSRFLSHTETIKFSFLHYKNDFLKKEVLIVALGSFLLALHFGAEAVAYGPFLKNNLHLNLQQIGFYMATAIAFMAITALILPRWLKDKNKVRTIFLTGLILSGLGHILMTYPQLEFSLIGRIIHEIGDVTVFLFLSYSISILFPTFRIGGNSSLITLTFITGDSIGSLIFGSIATHYGYQWPLIISGLLTLLTFAIITSQRHLIRTS